MKKFAPPARRCGNYNCDREAKYQRSDLVITDPNNADQQNLAKERTRCGVHGPGPEKRSAYRYKFGWEPITDLALQALALRYERVRKAIAEDRAKSEQLNHERRRELAKRYWKDRDEEPEYVLRYEEEIVYGGDLVRKWSIYSSAEIAQREAWAVEHPDEAKYVNLSSLIEVSVRDESPYDDVTYPVSLRSRVGSELTPKLANVYAKALAEATEVVEAMNIRLREKHNGEVE